MEPYFLGMHWSFDTEKKEVLAQKGTGNKKHQFMANTHHICQLAYFLHALKT